MDQKQLLQIQAIFEKGIKAQKSGDFQGAKLFYEQALSLKPDDPNILQNMAMLHMRHERFSEALFWLKKTQKHTKSTPQITKALAIANARMGKHADALIYFQKHLTHTPDDDSIAIDYLSACLNLKEYDAILAYAAKSAPEADNWAHIQVYACEAELALAKHDAALKRMQNALKHAPDDTRLLPALTKAYNQNRLFDDALKIAERCTTLEPDAAMHWNNLGNALKNTGQYKRAHTAFEKARTLEPRYAALTLTNQAYIYKRTRDLPKAIACADQALEIDPTLPDAHYAYGTLQLMAGNYTQAWPHIEWRFHRHESAVRAPGNINKIWYGDPLEGKSICIYADQGIGDTIQMLRYIPLVQALGPRRIVIAAEQKLAPLIAANFPDIEFKAFEDPDFNLKTINTQLQIAFCSLPGIFNTTLNTVPTLPALCATQTINYSTADKPLVIGLSWFTKSLDAGYKRSLALSAFNFLKDIQGIQLIDLQYGDTAPERESAAKQGLHLLHDETVDSWADMQSFINQVHACDLVISIDNTTVHGAGAAGIPVWTLLPYDPFWRWHEGASSPWYPTMRLFRQDAENDYDTPLAAIRAELIKLVKGDKSVLIPAPFKAPANPTQAKQALLLNDTSAWYHWGCTGTSGAIHTQLEGAGYSVTSGHHRTIADARIPAPLLPDFDNAKYLAFWRYHNPTLYDAMQKADIVVINGEGTIHGMADNARKLLYLAYIAKTAFNKPVHIINHACYPQDGLTMDDPNIIAYYIKGYQAATTIAVRDKGSHSLLSQLGFSPIQAFDSLPLDARLWRIKQASQSLKRDDKHIILAGSSKFSTHQATDIHKWLRNFDKKGYRFTCLLGAKHHPATDDRDFIDMLKSAPIDVDIHYATSLDEWYRTLATAGMLVSGRFHYTIAAACLNTPFIAFEGNTPKLALLSEQWETPPPLRYSQKNLFAELNNRTNSIIERIATNGYPEKENKIKELEALSLKNYDFLG